MRPDSPSWTTAKAAGDETEKLFSRWLRRRGGEVWRSVGEASADLEVRWRIEVKHDLQAPTTGNVAVEVEYAGKPSGIHTSSATHWVFHVGDELFLIEKSILLTMLAARTYTLCAAGDGRRARVRLVPLPDLRQHSRTVRVEDVE